MRWLTKTVQPCAPAPTPSVKFYNPKLCSTLERETTAFQRKKKPKMLKEEKKSFGNGKPKRIMSKLH